MNSSGSTGPARQTIQIRKSSEYGWNSALVLTNAVVEAVVVPEVGRVMQLRFVGENHGPFWVNEELRGSQPDPASAIWQNFGGDKPWPAPQSTWAAITGAPWPPPKTFDCSPYSVRQQGGELEMISPLDSNYGVRAVRKISLDASRPVMRIATEFQKESGAPLEIGAWVITQLRDAERIFVPMIRSATQSYKQITGPPPLDCIFQNNLLSLRRRVDSNVKISCDSRSMLWMNAGLALRIDGSENCEHVEVYTNKDPDKYVELETLGPVRRLCVGERLAITNNYTLYRRKHQDPWREAQMIYTELNTSIA
jgi:hypothetical protein